MAKEENSELVKQKQQCQQSNEDGSNSANKNLVTGNGSWSLQMRVTISIKKNSLDGQHHIRQHEFDSNNYGIRTNRKWQILHYK